MEVEDARPGVSAVLDQRAAGGRHLWDDCPGCSGYLRAHPLVVAACASVGIEHGKSTRQMMIEYFLELHERDHR